MVAKVRSFEVNAIVKQGYESALKVARANEKAGAHDTVRHHANLNVTIHLRLVSISLLPIF